MATATTFHQIEVMVALELEFSIEQMGGYDTSQVYLHIFLDPRIIPSLPTSQPLEKTCNSQHAPSVGWPKSPSGATYELPQVSQEVGDYLYAWSLIGPVYKHIFDSQDPEESSKKQMAELKRVLAAAKDKLKVAYCYAVRKRDHYVAIRPKLKTKQSRWQEKSTILSNATTVWESSVPKEGAVGGNRGSKARAGLISLQGWYFHLGTWAGHCWDSG
ncbi:hypothetical protein FIBSPDRAFT_900343 [Athelia psychrophila]|uniref:Uncharacterized protein n=1 Tax=Athelia psychrophila TaxID=1759441 RepID=A0A165YKW6_9AGAM|nr:hypothetical protein FIBSPDRAFT_900343 [Fibularhizoctonia sp. CBS 109695]